MLLRPLGCSFGLPRDYLGIWAKEKDAPEVGCARWAQQSSSGAFGDFARGQARLIVPMRMLAIASIDTIFPVVRISVVLSGLYLWNGKCER